MQKPVITIADDDSTLVLARMALEGDATISQNWLRAYFAPEPIELSEVTDLAARWNILGGASVRYVDRKVEGNLREISRGSNIVICRRAKIGRDIIQGSPNLKAIVRLGARAAGIDLDAAERAGVAVTCVARPSLCYTAEHAILLALAVEKALVVADRAVRHALYDPERVTATNNVAYNWPGLSGLGGLYGRTFGIVGLGEVGTLVARLARAFGARVVYTKPVRLDIAEEQALDVEYRPFADLIEEADILSIHARESEETRGLINLDVLRRMKRTAILVNTSRGALVDEDALAEALERRLIRGAGIDVHTVEPRAAGDRLSQLDNIVMTPHIGAGSRRGLLAEIDQIMEAVARALGTQA